MKINVIKTQEKEVPSFVKNDFAHTKCGMREPEVPAIILKKRIMQKEKKNGDKRI